MKSSMKEPDKGDFLIQVTA